MKTQTKEKIKCPECKGKKQITVTMQDWGKPETKTSHQIDCVTCDGKGFVTAERSQEWCKYQNMWCTCKKPSDDIYFMDDGECDCGIEKHHYHCSICDGITQIG